MSLGLPKDHHTGLQSTASVHACARLHPACSTQDNPRWYMIQLQLVRRLERPVTLAQLRAEGARAGSVVADMVLLRR